jgi:hypothetical protein
MKAYGGGCIDPHFRDFGIGGEWWASRPSSLNPPILIGYAGWTLPGFELRHLGRPAHSQSLYRLRHPGSTMIVSGMHYAWQIRLANKLFQSHRSTRYASSRQHWRFWLSKRRMRQQSTITRQGLQLTQQIRNLDFPSKTLVFFVK